VVFGDIRIVLFHWSVLFTGKIKEFKRKLISKLKNLKEN